MSDTFGTPLNVTLPKGDFTASVQRAVEQAVAATVPAGKRGALVAVVNNQGVAGGATLKLDKQGNWKLHGEAGVDWQGDVNGALVLVGAW
jgi:hypothetical protein